MTNQQAPEIYTLHTVPNKGERPWFGIYTVRADAEHDAKVMRDVTGRDWSVVRLVVADTNDRVPEAWTNLLAYVLQEELHNRLTPRVIDIAHAAFMQAKRPYDEDGGASDWLNDTRPKVRELIAKLRKDLIEELPGAPQPVPSAEVAQQAGECVYAFRRKGLANFCTCDEACYKKLLTRPHLFETRIFYTAPQPSPTTQADSVLEDATRAAARALSDRVAEMCNVDKEDHWKYHSDDVLSDAELVVSTYLAARAPADSVTAPAGGVGRLSKHKETE